MSSDREIDFVAKRYRQNKFSVHKAWNRLGVKHVTKYRRIGAAAATAGIIILSATAAVVYHTYYSKPVPTVLDTQKQSADILKESVRIIDFENTPLPTVILKIKEVYGVEIADIPDNASQYRLSLHFEGNVVDLVDAINDLLETQMSVKE